MSRVVAAGSGQLTMAFLHRDSYVACAGAPCGGCSDNIKSLCIEGSQQHTSQQQLGTVQVPVAAAATAANWLCYRVAWRQACELASRYCAVHTSLWYVNHLLFTLLHDDVLLQAAGSSPAQRSLQLCAQQY